MITFPVSAPSPDGTESIFGHNDHSNGRKLGAALRIVEPDRILFSEEGEEGAPGNGYCQGDAWCTSECTR
jgi:hypothetical protein